MPDRPKRLDERGLLVPLLISALLIACAGPPLAAAHLSRCYGVSGEFRLLEVYVMERPLVCARLCTACRPLGNQCASRPS